MTYDTSKLVAYGQKIGAEVAIVERTGKVRNYYRKADRESKWCSYTYANHNNGRPLRWESTGEFSYLRIIEFNRAVLKQDFDVIEIPALEKQIEQ